MKSENPTCYGKPDEFGNAPGCIDCDYRESCEWYIRNPPPKDEYARDTKGHHVSIDRFAYSEETSEAAGCELDCDDPETCEKDAEDFDRPVYTRRDFYRLLMFLFREIDDYTLAIMIQMVRGDVASSAELARIFGVSREAMHRKISDECRRSAEIRAMMIGVLTRCGKLRNADEFVSPKKQSKQANKKQMELGI